MEFETEPKSEFNDAIGYLKHINSLFRACSVLSINLDIIGWFYTLNALFRVLSAEMTPEQIKEFKERQNTINSKISGHLHNRNASNQIPPEIYNQLQDYEIFLRNIFKNSGLMNKLMESAERALK